MWGRCPPSAPVATGGVGAVTEPRPRVVVLVLLVLVVGVGATELLRGGSSSICAAPEEFVIRSCALALAEGAAPVAAAGRAVDGASWACICCGGACAGIGVAVLLLPAGVGGANV